MEQAAAMLAGLERHGVTMGSAREGKAEADRRGLVLGAEQTDALELVTNRGDLALVVGYAGTGKSAMLGVARATWEAERYTVRGLALSGIAAPGGWRRDLALRRAPSPALSTPGRRDGTR